MITRGASQISRLFNYIPKIAIYANTNTAISATTINEAVNETKFFEPAIFLANGPALAIFDS